MARPIERAGLLLFLILTTAVSILAGAIAAVTGFGIGSLLTPLLNLRYDMRLAVATVSMPHAIATAVRLWMLKRDVDRRVLKSFGLMSAAGGLTGAILQSYATAPSLTILFAALLTFAGIAALAGFSERMHLGRTSGWIAGVVSGALGGLVWLRGRATGATYIRGAGRLETHPGGCHRSECGMDHAYVGDSGPKTSHSRVKGLPAPSNRGARTSGIIGSRSSLPEKSKTVVGGSYEAERQRIIRSVPWD